MGIVRAAAVCHAAAFRRACREAFSAFSAFDQIRKNMLCGMSFAAACVFAAPKLQIFLCRRKFFVRYYPQLRAVMYILFAFRQFFSRAAQKVLCNTFVIYEFSRVYGVFQNPPYRF